MFRIQFSHFLFKSILFSTLLYSIIITYSLLVGIDPQIVLRDPMQTYNHPITVGLLSNLGIILWVSSGAISIFASSSGLVDRNDWKQFILLGGIFSMVLGFDDLFLLHDRQQIFQDILYTTYIIFTIYLVFKFRKLIYTSNTLNFALPILFLALSVLSDIFQDFLPLGYETVQIFEEGFKFVGIASWLSYWIYASRLGILTK